MGRRSTEALLNDIIDASRTLNLPDPAKVAFQRLVRRMGASHGVSGMALAEQVEFAGRLLSAGVSRPTIRDRLAALYRISRSQAYKVIQDALNCPQSKPISGRSPLTLNPTITSCRGNDEYQ